MLKRLIYITVVNLLLIGCGSSENGILSNKSNNSEIKSVQNLEHMTVAKDNLLRNVIKPFNGYKIRVLTDKILGEDDVSKDTLAVYGMIDSKNTASLLRLNSNYPVGTTINIEVLSTDGKTVLGRSKTKIKDKNIIYFGSIKTDTYK